MNRNATIKLVNNTANFLGGAIHLEQSCFFIISAVLQLQNNIAIEAGGAISLCGSHIDIRKHANVTFVNNKATLRAGAIYQSIAGYISIDAHSCLEFYSNSAGQGGALYLTSPGSLIVGHKSTVIFANNSAVEAGGAVYAYTHLDLPCFLFLKTHSNVIKFKKNSATRGGLHIYGASIRSDKCTGTTLFPTYSYCNRDLSVCSIHLKSDLSNNLSLVPSDPKRVCLCDPRGQPQCANLPYIFVGTFMVSQSSFLWWLLVMTLESPLEQFMQIFCIPVLHHWASINIIS